MEYNLPFKVDKKGLLYLDEEDIKIKNLDVKQVPVKDVIPAKFYAIDGINDLIIKDCTIKPFRFNRYENLKLLKSLIKRQENVDKVEFPIGYTQVNNKFRGTLIPYYKDAVSIYEVMTFYTFEDLHQFYDKESDDIDNFVSILLEILEILKCLCENGIYYLDIGPTNFLLYNNSVKLIDFEPGRICFHEKKWNTDIMLMHYRVLVGTIIRNFKFKDAYLYREIDFSNAEYYVKDLRKRLER